MQLLDLARDAFEKKNPYEPGKAGSQHTCSLRAALNSCPSNRPANHGRASIPPMPPIKSPPESRSGMPSASSRVKSAFPSLGVELRRHELGNDLPATPAARNRIRETRTVSRVEVTKIVRPKRIPGELRGSEWVFSPSAILSRPTTRHPSHSDNPVDWRTPSPGNVWLRSTRFIPLPCFGPTSRPRCRKICLISL